MSLDDDSSMGMNKTTVAEISADSIGLTDTSGDAMETTLRSTLTYAVAPRKSMLPFASTQSQEPPSKTTNDFRPGLARDDEKCYLCI